MWPLTHTNGSFSSIVHTTGTSLKHGYEHAIYGVGFADYDVTTLNDWVNSSGPIFPSCRVRRRDVKRLGKLQWPDIPEFDRARSISKLGNGGLIGGAELSIRAPYKPEILRLSGILDTGGSFPQIHPGT